jgi:aldehyde dehydrogenase (NAD+)
MTRMTRFEGKNYIGGQWRPAASGRTFEQHNPAKLAEVTGTFAESGAQDADAAIAAAKAAFPEWRALSPQARKRFLEQSLGAMRARRDEIAAVITRENGKSLREARNEVDSGLREMDYQISEGLRACGQTVPVEAGGTLAYSTREPLGPVGIVTPWNFPFNVPSRKCTPALMAGNTVVLKPASLTPRTGLLYAELIAAGGVPPGAINCVTGAGRAVGNAIVGDSRIKAISFTGSTAVGKAIQVEAARNLTPTQLELGGKNPAIVLADADLDHAVAEIVRAAYTVAGQWCTSTSRVIVVEEIAEQLTSKLVAAVRGIVVCGAQQQKDVLRYIDVGKAEGARLLCGGAALTGAAHDGGCFVAPTIFGGVTRTMKIAREEIFGPVLVIVTVRDFEEAVAVANDVAYGLASSIFTNDLKRALTYMERAEVGIAHVNLMTPMREPQLPFGGVKESGVGLPEAGSSAIEFFTHHKVCYVKYR